MRHNTPYICIFWCWFTKTLNTVYYYKTMLIIIKNDLGLYAIKKRSNHMEQNNISDYLAFRKMITPLVIQMVFWISIAITILTGLAAMIQSFFIGLLIIILGPIALRIYFELIILLFRINETLTDIKNNTDNT